MALPRINETLNFSMTVPSLGKQVKFRPYLVKEEKVLLQAFESKDATTCLEAMCDTIASCLDQNEGVDVYSLATFDIEYMFTQLRAKSVGEESTIYIKCKEPECRQPNEYTIKLDTLSIEVGQQDKIIPITDDISVEMKYPSFRDFIENDITEDNVKDVKKAMKMIASSLKSVNTPEERIDCSTQPKEEIEQFIDSMTAGQLKKLTDFLQLVPALQHDAVFTCFACKTENELKLQGLSDFF